MGFRGPAGRPTVPCAYLWRLALYSVLGRGDVGLEVGLPLSSVMAVSYCLEYLLLADGVGKERAPEWGGRGELPDEGVYC